MKTYTNTFNTYNANEIGELAKHNPGVMSNLKEEAYNAYEETFLHFYSEEALNTLKAFADILHTSLTDYSLSLDSYDIHATFNVEAYNELSNEEKHNVIHNLTSLYLKEAFCKAELTGVCYDCYIHDLLKVYWDEGKQSFDFNLMTRMIKNLPTDFSKQVCTDEAKNAYDLEYFLVTAQANELEFHEDGTVYKW